MLPEGNYSGIIIRKAMLQDLPDIYTIEKLSFKAPYSRQYLIFLLANADVFIVAQLGNRIVGYSCGMLENYKGDLLGHVYSVAVHPEYRRMGLGTLLMQKTIEEFKRLGARAIRLECRVSNTGAIRLYEKLGFRIVSTMKKYYEDGEDAYVFVLTL
ncbi:MAG: ribosomal protein S18-alanine N-acetyltransferase [Candidatus Korarchaeota archaeon]|nr:ribosomal protein S18-alanine N-acetyltransferase [Thermoproteota archaeon]